GGRAGKSSSQRSTGRLLVGCAVVAGAGDDRERDERRHAAGVHAQARVHSQDATRPPRRCRGAGTARILARSQTAGALRARNPDRAPAETTEDDQPTGASLLSAGARRFIRGGSMPKADKVERVAEVKGRI